MFSDAIKNRNLWGKPFNQQGQSTPAPVAQETKDAATARNQQVEQEGKGKVGRYTESHTLDEKAHNEWIDFVNRKLLELSDNC